MPAASDNASLEQELSPEQVAEFCTVLGKEKGLSWRRIAQLAKERYGVEAGKNKVYTFKNGPFAKHLEALQRRAQLARFFQEHSTPTDGSTIADAASAEMAEQVLELLMEGEPFDLATKDGRQRADVASKIIARLRSGDRSQQALQLRLQQGAKVMKEARGVLSDPASDAKAREAALAQMDLWAGVTTSTPAA